MKRLFIPATVAFAVICFMLNRDSVLPDSQLGEQDWGDPTARSPAVEDTQMNEPLPHSSDLLSTGAAQSIGTSSPVVADDSLTSSIQVQPVGADQQSDLPHVSNAVESVEQQSSSSDPLGDSEERCAAHMQAIYEAAIEWCRGNETDQLPGDFALLSSQLPSPDLLFCPSVDSEIPQTWDGFDSRLSSYFIHLDVVAGRRGKTNESMFYFACRVHKHSLWLWGKRTWLRKR